MKEKEQKGNISVSSLIRVKEKMDTNMRVKSKGRLWGFCPACKEHGSHHSFSHAEKKLRKLRISSSS
jgi:hypothetical protein